ncbi:hypothetical protein OROGR_025769 [Orobanche gracilis]
MRWRVIQIFAHGARILDGAFMTQELNFKSPNSETAASEGTIVSSVSIADPYVLLRMSDGSIQILVGDPSTCSVSITIPPVFESFDKSVSACTLYHDKGPEPWLRKTCTDAWLSTGIGESIDGSDGMTHDQGDAYCVLCYENGNLEIRDVPNFSCVFSVDNFVSGKSYILDTVFHGQANDLLKFTNKYPEDVGKGRKETPHDLKVVELSMQRWGGEHSRPFLFGILSDGSIICYHAYVFEVTENASKAYGNLSSISASRLRNLRLVRVSLDTYAREETPSGISSQRITIFKNVGGLQGFFLSGSRPTWFMVFRERIRLHPQVCDGPIVAFTVFHNVNCNHGFIYITSEGALKICQLSALSSYDNYWPVRKIALKGTPHQVTCFPEKNLYPLIVFVPVLKPINQVLSSLIDQEVGNQFEHDNLNLDGTYPVEEYEIRIMEPEKLTGPWQTRATIPMQSSENALTVRVVTLFNTTTQQNETLLAVGTAYAQGEDVAARDRVLLYSVEKNSDGVQAQVSEVYSKELKGAISALASLQGHLLLASGPKIILHKWTGSDLNGVAFYDVPPLYVVSLNIVKNFILLGDIHKSIYFLSWKEQGSQLNLLAKDFGSLDCLATEFLIDGSTLSLSVSDEQKNIQIFYYAPKMSESWKGQKLLSRADIGLNPRSFGHFNSNGKAHRPGPDSIVDCELLSHYEMLPLEEQLDIAQKIGTTRTQIISNLNDLILATSFL